ncbi:MAG: transferase [Paramuribaculum sp.]|nr:transferase [Paramuribaculum sp.]
MNTTLALIGGGGHAVSLMEMMPCGYSVAGYVDFEPCDGLELPWLGTDCEFMARYPSMPVHIAVVMGRDGNMKVRRGIIDRYACREMPVIVSSSALVTSHVIIGRGSAVMHRVVINGANIGECNVINTGAIIEHGVSTGSNVFIGPGAVICGGVTIGSDVMIGAGAVIRSNVAIPSGTVIGMGSVVTKSIDKSGVYAGNPCKLL